MIYSNDPPNWNVKQKVGGLGVHEVREYATHLRDKYEQKLCYRSRLSCGVWDRKLNFCY
ncbi:MAG: hypothetical protein LBE72_02795 [Rickettsia sp.]|nr:hypothetical protein [Rickettsia sp.]